MAIIIINNHFSGAGRAIGRAFVYACIGLPTITFDLDNLVTRYFA